MLWHKMQCAFSLPTKQLIMQSVNGAATIYCLSCNRSIVELKGTPPSHEVYYPADAEIHTADK